MKEISIVREIYAACDGNVDNAIERLIAASNKDSSLLESLVYQGAKAVITAIYRAERSETIANRNEEVYAKMESNRKSGIKTSSNRAAAIGSFVSESLMNLVFRIDGKTFRLKDATRELLEPTVNHYLSQGKTMIRRGEWLERVMGGLSGDEKVSDKFSEKELKEMLDGGKF